MNHLFFLGIAGHAMGGLALAAKNRGFTVSGLDETAGPPMTNWLDDHEITWTKSYTEDLMQGVDTVVISGHHGGQAHPVMQFAKSNNLKVVSFAELVGELTKGKNVIAVAGTHGKTTTTSLITWFLEAAGKKPDYLVGIRPLNFDSSSRLDGAETVVIEADEYKASTLDPSPKFIYYHPSTLVLTSLEHDHPDIFPTFESYIQEFQKLVKNMQGTSTLVHWKSDNIAKVADNFSGKKVSYGLNGGDFTANDIAFTPSGLEFDVISNQQNLGRLTVPVYGKHNVLNSLAATAAVLAQGVSFGQIKSGAPKFKGAFRRFNILTPAGSKVTVIDDYAHHPTEAMKTIEAAKLHFNGRRLVVLYRPHTYSRTQTLLPEYHLAFDGADKLYITDVEPAREAANQRIVSGQEIIDGLPQNVQQNSEFVEDRDELVQKIVADSKPGDVVLCMTVSGYGDIAGELAKKLV